MQKFNVKISQLQALAILASKEDIRYYLNGVRVEFNYDVTRLVSTDGHKLGLYNFKIENEGVGVLTIPRSFIDKLPKVTNKTDEILAISHIAGPQWQATALGGNTYLFNEIEGNYPDYSRVIAPIKTNGQPGQFNDEYLAQFKKCGLLLTWLKKQHFFPEIIHNGNSSAIIQLPTLLDQFVGVIMPLKSDFIESAIVDPAIYAPLVQQVTVENNGLRIVSDSEKIAA